MTKLFVEIFIRSIDFRMAFTVGVLWNVGLTDLLTMSKAIYKQIQIKH